MKDTNKVPRLLIVDDDPVLQAFLEDYLSQNNYQISFVEAGEELEPLLSKQSVDLVILDILLPGKDGFHWLNWLYQNFPNTKVIMLSVKGQDDDRIHALESGAHDFLSKPFNPRELLARINNLLPSVSNKTSDELPLFQFGEFSFDMNNQCLTKNKANINLTNAEFIFLSCLCKTPRKVVTRDELSYAHRGDIHNPLDRSIDVHINRLRGKIEADPASPNYIRTVWGKGYLFHIDT